MCAEKWGSCRLPSPYRLIWWMEKRQKAPAQFGCCVKEKMLLSYFLPRGDKWTLSSANLPVKFSWQRRTKSAMGGMKKWKREGKQKCLRLNMNYTYTNRGEGHEPMTNLWENLMWWPICERIWCDDQFVREFDLMTILWDNLIWWPFCEIFNLEHGKGVCWEE
jgi:hypothetical protein